MGMSKYKVIERLKEQESSIDTAIGSNRIIDAIKYEYMNRSIRLSIQASMFHYCEPRRTIDLDYYETLEMRIISELSLKQIFSGADDILRELAEYEDAIHILDEPKRVMGVYYNVPVELIEKIYLHLEKLFGEA